jgi:soluble lytic murein transglycosylase-like protein
MKKILCKYVLLIFFFIGILLASENPHAATRKEIYEYSYYICKYYKEKQLTGDLISAIIERESQWDMAAVGLNGEKGYMQMTVPAIKDVITNNPIKCKGWTIESVQTNWKRNIWSGINYLNQQFLNADGDLREALRMYNRGASSPHTNYDYADSVTNVMKNPAFYGIKTGGDHRYTLTMDDLIRILN